MVAQQLNENDTDYSVLSYIDKTGIYFLRSTEVIEIIWGEKKTYI